MVQLASHLAETAGLPAFEGITQWPLDPAVFTILQADPVVLPELNDALTQEIEKAEGFFALIDAST